MSVILHAPFNFFFLYHSHSFPLRLLFLICEMHCAVCGYTHTFSCLCVTNMADGSHPLPGYRTFPQQLTARVFFRFVSCGPKQEPYQPRYQVVLPEGFITPLNEIQQLSITFCCIHIQACNNVASKRPYSPLHHFPPVHLHVLYINDYSS